MKLDGDKVILTVTFDRNSVLYNNTEVGLFFCRDFYSGQIMAEACILWKDALKSVGLEWRNLNSLRDLTFDIRMSKFAFPVDQRAEAKLFKDCQLVDGDLEQSQSLIIIEHAIFKWRGGAESVDPREFVEFSVGED